jgi:hypothetical protein
MRNFIILYSLPNIVRMIKLGRMKLDRYLAYVEEIRSAYKILALTS